MNIIQKAIKFRKLYDDIMEDKTFLPMFDSLIESAAMEITEADAEYIDKELSRYGYGSQDGMRVMVPALCEAIRHLREHKRLSVKSL